MGALHKMWGKFLHRIYSYNTDGVDYIRKGVRTNNFYVDKLIGGNYFTIKSTNNYIKTFSKNVICHGNSLTYGIGSSISWPSLLYLENQTLLPVNLGHSGFKTSQLISLFSTEVLPLYSHTLQNIILFQEGYNDKNGGATDQQAYDHIVTYCGLARAAGFKIIIFTNTPASFIPLNTMLLSNWQSFCDGIIDVRGNDGGVLTGSGAPYFFDSIHLTQAGYQYEANWANTAINNLT